MVGASLPLNAPRSGGSVAGSAATSPRGTQRAAHLRSGDLELRHLGAVNGDHRDANAVAPCEFVVGIDVDHLDVGAGTSEQTATRFTGHQSLRRRTQATTGTGVHPDQRSVTGQAMAP